MVRCLQVSLALAGSILGGDGARLVKKHQPKKNSAVKFVGGVPILNYDLAYGGGPSLTELGQAVEEKWVVMMKHGATKDDIRSFCAGRACKLSGDVEQGGLPFVELMGTEQDLVEAFSSAQGLATFVEPNIRAYMIPELTSQASASNSLWGLERIGAGSRATEGQGVHVYVLDTGVRTTHEQFGGRAVPTLDVTTHNPTECKGDATCALDKQGHGTHCAGTAAGRTYGVAPKAQVHVVKVLDDRGSGELSWSYYGLDWIATKGARPAVASLSLGVNGKIAAWTESVTAAVAAGVTVVVAGGNSATDACEFSPAYVPEAITVGATDSNDARSFFSNYGRCTDIYAPGTEILSAHYESDDSTARRDGTSMACPAVSGGAALILAASPNLTPAQVLDKMLETAETGAISGVKTWHANKLLWVSAAAAAVPAPTPAPDWGQCVFYCSQFEGLCLMNECAGCDFC